MIQSALPSLQGSNSIPLSGRIKRLRGEFSRPPPPLTPKLHPCERQIGWGARYPPTHLPRHQLPIDAVECCLPVVDAGVLRLHS